ncbi:MAG: tetratricopeptide repeat protein, partial [Marinirhabdus sp.]
EKNAEAMLRFKQAATTATSKVEKHKAFHNLGNTFMNEKKYQEAVEAYKSALRNNPKDEETRYNLALAKDMLEKNPPESGGGDDEKDKEEQDKNEQNQDQKDKNEENEDKQNEGDKGDEKEEKDQGGEEDEKKEGDKNQKKAKPNEPKDGQQEQQPKQPVPGQLSPQQVKNLLEAMNNEEKKVQDKINAQKQKGAKVRPTKDW